MRPCCRQFGHLIKGIRVLSPSLPPSNLIRTITLSLTDVLDNAELLVKSKFLNAIFGKAAAKAET